MSSDLVSVITASYNYESYISETIQSILSQSHRNIQYIIVDDCSTDNSPEIIERHRQRDSRIEFIKMPKNTGGPPAYAEACKLIKGNFICCIDADDIIPPNKISRQLEFFSQHPEFDLCTTFVEIIDKNSKPIPSPNMWEDWSNVDRDLSDISTWMVNNFVAHSAVMMRRTAHDRVGPLDPHMSYAPDFEHWVRFIASGSKFGLLPEKLLRYRVHGNNHTHKNPKSTFFETIYIFWRHVMPALVAQRRLSDVALRVHLITEDEQFALLSYADRARLLSTLTRCPAEDSTYSDFLSLTKSSDPYAGEVLDAAISHSPYATETRKLYNLVQSTATTTQWLKDGHNFEIGRQNSHWLYKYAPTRLFRRLTSIA